MQRIEHPGKRCTIRNSAHRKLSSVFSNNSSGNTIAEAANIWHISIFSICEDVWRFSQHSYHITINSHNSQLTLHTNSHASDSCAVWWEERTILGAKSKLLYSETALYQGTVYTLFCLE
jgi:hypothetical protein